MSEYDEDRCRGEDEWYCIAPDLREDLQKARADEVRWIKENTRLKEALYAIKYALQELDKGLGDDPDWPLIERIADGVEAALSPTEPPLPSKATEGDNDGR